MLGRSCRKQFAGRTRPDRKASLPVDNTQGNCNTCHLDLGFFLGNQVNPRMVHIQEAASRKHLVIKKNYDKKTENKMRILIINRHQAIKCNQSRSLNRTTTRHSSHQTDRYFTWNRNAAKDVNNVWMPVSFERPLQLYFLCKGLLFWVRAVICWENEIKIEIVKKSH